MGNVEETIWYPSLTFDLLILTIFFINFFDHCPVLLISKNVDWGPKPFWMLDCWLQDKSFKDVVINCWS